MVDRCPSRRQQRIDNVIHLGGVGRTVERIDHGGWLWLIAQQLPNECEK
jgi:hypothetical protein